MCASFKGIDENRKTRCNLGKMTFHKQSLLKHQRYFYSNYGVLGKESQDFKHIHQTLLGHCQETREIRFNLLISMIQQEKNSFIWQVWITYFFLVFIIVDKRLYHKAFSVSFDILKLYYAHDLLCKYLTLKFTLAILKNFNSLTL